MCDSWAWFSYTAAGSAGLTTILTGCCWEVLLWTGIMASPSHVDAAAAQAWKHRVLHESIAPSDLAFFCARGLYPTHVLGRSVGEVSHLLLLCAASPWLGAEPRRRSRRCEHAHLAALCILLLQAREAGSISDRSMLLQATRGSPPDRMEGRHNSRAYPAATSGAHNGVHRKSTWRACQQGMQVGVT
jgi:hypothetical protein